MSCGSKRAAVDSRSTTCVDGSTWTTATSTVTGAPGSTAGAAAEPLAAAVTVQSRCDGSHAPLALASGKRAFSKKSGGA
jgi:hypothetical protein